MSVDLLPEQESPSRAAPSSAAPDAAAAESDGARKWKRVLIGLGALVIVVAAGAIMSSAAAPSVEEVGMTHTITRGSLEVSVTEQGQLESSQNIEIKCRVRGGSTVLKVIEVGTKVEPGTVLVELDQSTIEDNINQNTITYQAAVATHTQSEADVAVAKIAIDEYIEGTFRSEMQTLQKDLAIAQSNLRTARNMLEHSERMFKKGYTSELEVESNQFTVEQAQLELDLKKTEIEVLEKFTKAKMLKELRSTLEAKEAKLASDKAAMDLAEARLIREKEQLENCIIKAESSGMVIYPSAAEWKSTPDIEEGATVREDQILLLIPDLTQMQVKVGIHESKVDRIRAGMDARVKMLDESLTGTVKSVASITRPAGWWTGNVVKYDTIIDIDGREGVSLKPGMSVEVKVVLASYDDVLTIPVAAVVEQEGQFVCWVKTDSGVQRRRLELGDSNDQFIVVNGGVKEGDEVVLNPRAYIKEAQVEALKPDADKPADAPAETGPKGESQEMTDRDNNNGQKKKKPAEPKLTGAMLLKAGDKNGDGVLTIDEFGENAKDFGSTDTNQDGKVDLTELNAALKRAGAAASGKS